MLARKCRISGYEYFIVFLFIVMCGFTAQSIIPGKSYFLSFMCLLHIFRRQNVQSVRPLIFMILGYLVIGTIHIIKFGYFSQRTYINIPLLMLSGFYVMDKLGWRFKYAYLNLMTVLALISLFFYLIMLVSGYVPSIDFLEEEGYNGIFIFNMRFNEIAAHRNCGPFWEPGAFAGYILLVALMFFSNLNELWALHKKKCVILILALLSTLSSQGYISLFLIIFLYFVKGRLTVRIIFPCILFGLLAFFIYNQVSFLKDKVDTQLELAADWESNESLQSANRFTTTLLDLYYIKKSPVIGNTDNLKIRFSDHKFILDVIDRHGNYGSGSGVSSVIAFYGIPLFMLWLYLTYCALRKSFTGKETILALFFILFLGSAEAYNSYILYISFPFIILSQNSKQNYDYEYKN